MHAFLVLAHTDPGMCCRLVSRLAEHGPVHLHINASADPRPFAAAARLSTVVTPAVRVRWGSWSLCEAALQLTVEALRDPSVEQVTWLSGQHYPLQSPALIAGTAPRDRIALHLAPDAARGKPEWRFRSRFVSRFSPGSRCDVFSNGAVRRLPPLHYERVLGDNQLYAGTAWWSLTRRTAEEMLAWLDDNPRTTNYFSKLCVPDESVFHTAVGAVLRARAVQESREQSDPRTMTAGATTFVRWNGGRHPEPLTPGSIRQAAADGWWFARKFDSDHPELLAVAEEGWAHSTSKA